MPGSRRRRLVSWGLLGSFLALPLLADEPSLGDAARKERERREKRGETGAAARTLTEEDLASTRGQLANDPNAPSAMPPESKAAKPRGDSSRRGQGPAEGPSPDPQEAFWRARAGAARGDAAAAELASAQTALDDVLEQGRRAGAQPGWLR